MNTPIGTEAHGAHRPSSAYPALFDEQEVIQLLKHYLPAQAPLKDFIHHNTLHAFQNLPFYDGIRHGSEIFGYKVLLRLVEYRTLFQGGHIREDILHRVIDEHKGEADRELWLYSLLEKNYKKVRIPLVGRLRHVWRTACHIDMDTLVHPTLFRILCSYLDQGVSLWRFPVSETSFLASIRALEQHSFSSFFRSKRPRKLLLEGACSISSLLKIVVGEDATLYAQYLVDLQFAHQGWSGLVAQIEAHPETLLDFKPITLQEIIVLELLLEIDALDHEFGAKWRPLETRIDHQRENYFAARPATELHEVLRLWHDAYEWSYYDAVLAGIMRSGKPRQEERRRKRFQAMFCIDDRECSIRRYVEQVAPDCETYGTAGFFGVEFFYQPEGGKFHTKLCPAPLNPKHLIKEFGSHARRKKDLHLSKRSHSLTQGWIIAQTLGFWSALKLFFTVTRPRMEPAMTYAFQHHDKWASLTIENSDPDDTENGLQVGFTITEMVDRVEGLLRGIGLVREFAPLVYVIGHGSSSVNNPHYAAYDCGACSGRPGSVNARVVCHMANLEAVRRGLAERGIEIPHSTRFVGGLHDTCRDEIEFFDEATMSHTHLEAHSANVAVFEEALASNAKERSRRLDLIDSHQKASLIHQKIKNRSVSLFEPRPELNHATNALCIVGRRALTRRLFLDRRSFLNSYDYREDPEGRHLTGILKAVAPVCGGINLEYFFSRVDNQKLGAGSKLPHNVMGLFGVANGADGDLRPGLPSQMVEVHDPMRLLVVVEHDPRVVLNAMQQHSATYEWFINEWVHLVVLHPGDGQLYRFREGHFLPYAPLCEQVAAVQDMTSLLETVSDNLPVYQLI